MTELQLGLLIIGALLVAGVLAYNRIQERRARRTAEQAFRSAAGDALMGAPPRPRAAAAVDVRPAAPAREMPPEVEALPDARIDYVIVLKFQSPVAAETLREHWRAHGHRYARRVRLAVSLPDGGWQALDAVPGVDVPVLRAGLQLVSREGAIGEAELIEFRTAIETLAAASGGAVTAPEMRLAVERARELDDFCADADVQVVLHLVPAAGGALDLARLREAALGSGMSLMDDARLAQLDAAGQAAFTLARPDGAAFKAGEAQAAEVVLTLDVARVADAPGCFRAMAAFARELAAAQAGTLVDDNGRTLDDRALAAIEAQLGTVRAAFEARGIEPGSALATRLFA